MRFLWKNSITFLSFLGFRTGKCLNKIKMLDNFLLEFSGSKIFITKKFAELSIYSCSSDIRNESNGFFVKVTDYLWQQRIIWNKFRLFK